MTSVKTKWFIPGILYLSLGCLSLVIIHDTPNIGKNTTFWLFLIIWAMDCGAYIVGKLLGGPKLAPKLSPQKTWAGLFGGMVFDGAAGAIISYFLESDHLLVLVTISALVGGISQTGDLLESFAKRRFNVKDAGNIIPGHGGLMDRVDGLLAASLFLVAMHWVLGKGIPEWF